MIKKKKPRQFLLIALIQICLCLSLQAQEKVFFQKTLKVDHKKYKDIKGSCYLFDENVSATLYDRNGSDYSDIEVNLNGEDLTMEAFEDSENYLVLLPSEISRIVIARNDNDLHKKLNFLDSLIFIAAPDPQLKADYYLQLYESEDLQLLMDFDVAMSVVVERPPGGIIENKKFNKKYKVILLHQGEVIKSDLNKKKLTKAFKKYGDLIKWTKANNHKPNSYEGLVGFFESL